MGSSSLRVFSYYGRITVLVTLTPGQQVRPRLWLRRSATRWKKGSSKARHAGPLPPLQANERQGPAGTSSQDHSRVVQHPAAGARHTHPASHRPCRLPIPSAPQRVEGVDALWQCPLQTTLFVALEPPHQAPLSTPLPGLGCPLAQLPPSHGSKCGSKVHTQTLGGKTPGEEEPQRRRMKGERLPDRGLASKVMCGPSFSEGRAHSVKPYALYSRPQKAPQSPRASRYAHCC